VIFTPRQAPVPPAVPLACQTVTVCAAGLLITTGFNQPKPSTCHGSSAGGK